jgi:hypothetical protein
MDVIPLPSTPPDGVATATCAGCGAPLAADQRYCLACGRPCSPVRLAFLDVLQSEHRGGGVPLGNVLPGGAPVGYPPPPEPGGTLGALRRYSGLFGLLAVLLAALLIGLLVGHWLTGSASPGKQVFEVKGLGALAGAGRAATGSGASGSGTSTGSSPSGSSNSSGSSTAGHGSSTGASRHSSAASETSAEEAEAAEEVKTTKPLPAASKTPPRKLEKIAHTTGKQHAKEVAALGSAPIETGGH